MIVFPNCKINLGLNVLQKRKDGFHNIETVFYPLPLQDILEINPVEKGTAKQAIPFHTSGLHIDTVNADNICSKAYRLLKTKFPRIAPVQIHLHKSIPTGGGLGGGSADAAFTLLLINNLFKLQLTKRTLLKLASELGSDCPFFIINQPCFSKGRGELLEKIKLDLSAYKFVLVNPGIHVSTASMFTQIKPAIPKKSLREIIRHPVEKWKKEMKNDFEETAFMLYPEIGHIKDRLYKAGAVYASMSGSGSTVYGMFSKEKSVKLSFPSHYFVRELAGQTQ